MKIIDKVLGAKKSIAEVSREFRMPQATARLIINLFKETGRVFEKKSEVETREDEKTEMIQEYYRRLATYREVQGDRVSESHEEPQQVP